MWKIGKLEFSFSSLWSQCKVCSFWDTKNTLYILPILRSIARFNDWYILGVLMSKTVRDRHWVGDNIEKADYMWLGFAFHCKILISTAKYNYCKIYWDIYLVTLLQKHNCRWTGVQKTNNLWTATILKLLIAKSFDLEELWEWPAGTALSAQ